jgi:signal transduction histidine kinase
MTVRPAWLRRALHSLVTRVFLIGLVVLFVGTASRSYLIEKYLRIETQASVVAQQQALAMHAAQAIAQKIQLRQDALQRVASSLPRALLGQPESLRAWLHARLALTPWPFAGLWVEAANGQALAHYPPAAQAFQSARPSADTWVYIGRVGDEAAASIAVPLHGPDGRVQAVLRGVSTLKDMGLFEPLENYQNGQQGGYALVFPQERRVLTAGDAAHALQALAPPGADALMDHAASGHLGAGTWLHAPPGGGPSTEQFAALAPVPGAGWSVVAYVPTREAYAPIRRVLARTLDTLPLQLAIYFLLSGTALYFLLYPLTRSARYADRMSRGEIPLAELPIVYQDEVGDLTAAFNRLLAHLSEKSQELTSLKEIAETATLAKSRFLAAASHDLRQPMHALNLYLGALAGCDLPAKARPVMASVQLCAQTMDEMFRALLDISRLDAHVMQPEYSAFPIAVLLEKIHLEFAPQAQAKGLVLRMAPCTAIVYSDPELLERILRNLVSNAVRYTVHGKVLVGCRRTPSGVRLGVWDTGPGIAPDQQRVVFDEFHQLGNPERDRSQGLGLGLAIVQRLALLLNAPLALRSQLGRGSVFSVELPCALDGDPSPLPELLPMAVFPATLVGCLIAVVDDEALILNATRLLLEQWGCTVVTAASGAEMVAALGACARVPDAIVCDHRLRGEETGVDAIATLRNEFNSDIPAVLITGDTAQDRIQAIQATGLPILHKPLPDHVLKAALLRLVHTPLQA